MEVDTVFLLDRYATTRAGLAQALEARGLSVVGESESPEDALERIEAAKPGLLVMDVELEEGDALELVERALDVLPELAILAESAHPDPAELAPLWRAGVRGFVRKDEPVEIIVQAVEALRRGALFFSPEIAGLHPEAWSEQREPVFSERDKALLRQLAAGRTNAEMSESLGMSQRAVEYNLSRLYAALGVSSRLEAVLWAREHDLT